MTKEQEVQTAEQDSKAVVSCATPTHLVPQYSVRETAEGVELIVELPGVTRENLELELEGRDLTLRGATAPVEGVDGLTLIHREFSDGIYQRAFRLPAYFDPRSVEADLSNGQLTLKIGRNQPDRITIPVN